MEAAAASHELLSRHEALQLQHGAAICELNAIKAECFMLNSELGQCELDRDGLGRQIEGGHTQGALLEGQLSAAQGQVTAAQGQVVGLREEGDELRAQLEGLQQEVQGLQEEVAALNESRVASQQGTAKLVHGIVSKGEQQLKQATGEAEELKGEVQRGRAEGERLRVELNGRLQGLQGEMAQLKQLRGEEAEVWEAERRQHKEEQMALQVGGYTPAHKGRACMWG